MNWGTGYNPREGEGANCLAEPTLCFVPLRFCGTIMEMMGSVLRTMWVPAPCLALWACGIAESSGNGSDGPEATGGQPNGPEATGGLGNGGVWTEEGIVDCFSTFGIDPRLQIADLSEQQMGVVCSVQEAMFYCIHPDDRMCTYSAAIATGTNENPVERCHELEADCLNGAPLLPLVFECRIPGPPICPGTVGELETCLTDYVQMISERPAVEWTCENATEVISWTLDNVIYLPDSCAPYDGCAL